MAGTTIFALSTSQYEDLGPAPAQIQVLTGQSRFIVADAQPTNLTAPGIALSVGPPWTIQANDASSHVWGLALGAGSTIAVGNVFASGGGGGGGAVTIADGSDIAEGATNATAYADGTGAATGTVVGLLKGLFVGLGTKITAVAALPTGGVGIVGWLSRIWSQLTAQASIVTGQQKIAITATQLSVSSVPLVNGVVVTAKASNAGTVFIGGSTVNTTYDGTGNGYALAPGASVSIPVSNLNLVYSIGTLNDVIAWEGN